MKLLKWIWDNIIMDRMLVLVFVGFVILLIAWWIIESDFDWLTLFRESFDERAE